MLILDNDTSLIILRFVNGVNFFREASVTIDDVSCKFNIADSPCGVKIQFLRLKKLLVLRRGFVRLLKRLLKVNDFVDDSLY